ncbi:glycosyltransferase family 4 protein [Acidocella sp. KAb 2-4]|uniref:glycosyltransferase family 4 protein n=1 Tax=Acidocella sp. KAb 2-4 TaxID=2885158 RepID=UPI001D05DF7B|nr:glycosyltransferase family 4 protein [Acidocella sp. KAb 2-4]MCB5945761.1 glycosyltransferase family 4 protein [Acidocella sp. KAb 2-4]
MKVLIVSLYHPELVRGGAQQVAYELFEGLQQRADVEPYLLASADHNSPALFKSGARITGFDGRPNEFLFLTQEYDYAWEKGANVLLVEAFKEFLELIRPDVVHFHHFLTFGIDLLTLTRRVLPEVKIVFTAHEFLAICPANGHMVRRTDASLCTRASAVRCHQCLPERLPEHYFMRDMWMRRHLEAVDVFTTPSRFMISHYTNWGLDESKFVHVTNGMRARGVTLPAASKTGARKRFGFFGQMVDAKGLHVLLEAVALLRAGGFTDFTVEINGDNIHFATPKRRAEIEAFLAAEAEFPLAERNVLFNGSYHPEQLRARMARVDWVVVPSVWWEIFCLVISEAWSFGRPVIASNAGGPAERVRDGVDGMLFELGDARALADAMYRACTEDGLWDSLAAGITPPARQEEMVEGFVGVYSARKAA